MKYSAVVFDQEFVHSWTSQSKILGVFDFLLKWDLKILFLPTTRDAHFWKGFSVRKMKSDIIINFEKYSIVFSPNFFCNDYEAMKLKFYESLIFV